MSLHKNKAQNHDALLTDERLEQAIYLYEELSNTDNRGLRYRVYDTITRKRSLRRRWIALSGSVAAAAVLFMIITILPMHLPGSEGITGDNTPKVWNDGSVMLSTPDGVDIELQSEGAAIDEDAIKMLNDSILIAAMENTGKAVVNAGSEELNYRIYVPKGKQFHLTLADGTMVWLDSDSRIEFPLLFKSGERRVTVEGEVYFEVTPDAEKPFIVEAGSQIHTVLGTTFNISAYPENTIVTTLIRGKVAVDNGGMQKRFVLSPNQQVEFDPVSGSVYVRVVDTDAVVAWKNGMFAFDENTLEQMAAKLSRWYDIAIVFSDPSLRSITFKGTLPKYEDITKVLAFIEKSGGVKLLLDGNRITISR